jgi:hypothetical protein
MAAGPKLDGAGTVKLVTLDEAMLKLQGLHALVERMAVEQKGNKPITGMEQQLKRLAVPLQGQLKSQFSLIADLVTAMILIGGRGGPGKLKIRSYREMIAQLRTQLEIAVVQTKAKHAVEEEKKEPRD